MQGFNYQQLYQALQDWPYKASATYLANLNRIIFMGELRLIRDLDLDIFEVNDQVALSIGATTVPKPPQSVGIQFTANLSPGTTAATLSTNWTGVTGTYVVTFSDNELQIVTLTNGMNSAAWPSPGLANECTVNARVNSQFVAERSLMVVYNGAPKRLLKRSYDFVQNYVGAAQGQPKYFCDQGPSSLVWQIAPSADANATAVNRRYIDRPPSIVVAGNTWLGDNTGDCLFAACLMESEQFLKADDRFQDMSNKYYQILLPNARGEIQISGRRGDYAPLAPVASLPAPQMPQAAPQGQ
jgi:hypothetical protein